MKINEKIPALNGSITDPRTRRYLAPKRVVLTEGNVHNPESLLQERSNQITLGVGECCTMRNIPGEPKAKLVLDYGCEFPGSIRLMIWGAGSKGYGDDARCNIIVRTGESVMEAITPIKVKNTTNDHAIRDRVMNVGFYSANETNESGQRFVCVELIDDDAVVTFKAIQGVFHYLDLDYKGSFECSDEKLTRIWNTAAYTAHVNMQEYLWDGIKRDRLVWIGDMHTEVNTILATFGYNEIVPRSLDVVRDETPVGAWMNGISAYSIWWLLIHCDWYRAFGDKAYLEEQRDYLRGLLTLLASFVDEDGGETLPEGRLLDWPTNDDPVAKHVGFQGLLKLALDNGAYLLRELGEDETAALCEASSEKMKGHKPAPTAAKQANAFMVLAGLSDPVEVNERVMIPGGGHGYSTFMGYYIMAA
ncbi:MAG: alpha-L-rhamnosidase, partial [Clostridia bacterium]|nr:alpha-L-rhamnosidase [Clostridia bacterium]